tara:strand:+ start:6870 stop:7145 length:276 start_codon:yes stop_codon:yes gene_type:complete
MYTITEKFNDAQLVLDLLKGTDIKEKYSMSVWKYSISNIIYTSNINNKIDKCRDEKYVRSLFDIMYKQYDAFCYTNEKNINNQNVYYLIYK